MRKTLLSSALAFGAIAAAATAANAMITPLVLADWMVRESQKQAAATPGHADWCAKHRAGYRANWNNWRNADGTVTYCASPFYAPPWKVKPSQ